MITHQLKHLYQIKIMEIIHIPNPSFEYESTNIPTTTYRFPDLDLISFQTMINEKEQEGYTKCFFYSLYTTKDIDNDGTLHKTYWVRCRFLK